MKKQDVIRLLTEQVLVEEYYCTETDVRCMFVDLIDNLCHDLTESQTKRFSLQKKN